jgi:hypothetical protein
MKNLLVLRSNAEHRVSTAPRSSCIGCVRRSPISDRHDARAKLTGKPPQRILAAMARPFDSGLRLALAVLAIAVLIGCTEGGRPPLVNSGSSDWSDAYRGPNGYPLLGYGYAIGKTY